MRISLNSLLRSIGLIIAGFLSFFVLAQVIVRVIRVAVQSKPTPMPARRAFLLLSPLRRKLFGTPEQIIELAGVTPGQRVLEIGPGSGNFTIAMARRVAERGKPGKVTCVELQPEMIDLLQRRLREQHINNVEVVQGDAQALSLPKESFDLIFLATVVGEVPDKQALFRECERVLKPGGVLAVTEQISDPDFRLPAFSRKFADSYGFIDAGYVGRPWWCYTARYLKPSTKGVNAPVAVAK
jgi:SAM-dependent methyltransferase